MSYIDLRATAPRRDVGGATSELRGPNNILGWWLLAVLVLSALLFGSVHGFSWGLLAMLVGSATAVYSIIVLRRREQFRVPVRRLATPFGLFVILCLGLLLQALPLGFGLVISTAHGDVPGGASISIAADSTWLMLIRQVTYALFFFLMLQATVNDGRRRLLQRGILLVGIAYGVLALVTLQNGDTLMFLPKTAYLGAATGPFVNKNSFATFTAMCAMIALAQGCRQIVNQMERHPHDGRVQGTTSAVIMFGLAYLFLMTVLVATQSRMGLLVSLVGSTVVIAVAVSMSVSRSRAMIIVVGAIAATVISLFFFGADAVDRAITTDSTPEVRANLYRQVLSLIALRPGTGFGGGSFELAFPLVHDVPVALNMAWEKAHNTYLQLWSELGIVVGSVPILIYGWIVVRLIVGLSQRSTNWSTQAIALAAIIIAAVHSLVDFSLEIPANTFLLLALAASGVATTFRAPTARRAQTN